ncbi:hypothetical protein CLOP_g25215 [Closterium sp. NIES-67]|nr:hypothetical protein CLOP_g25215 [Closterium sp. NIES-67]
MSGAKRYRAEPGRKTVLLEVGESLRQAGRTGEAGSGGIGRAGPSAGRSRGRAGGGERNANSNSQPAAEDAADAGGRAGEAGALESGEWPRQAALDAELRARSGRASEGGRGTGRGAGGRGRGREDARRAGIAGSRGGSGMGGGGGSAVLRGSAGDASVERLQREATCYRLWGAGGTADATSAAAGAAGVDGARPATPPPKLPERFGSVEEYVRAFEPLLFEEARAQVASSWEEMEGGEGGAGGRAGGGSATVGVASLEETNRAAPSLQPPSAPSVLRIAGIGRRCYEPMHADRGAARPTIIFTFHDAALPPSVPVSLVKELKTRKLPCTFTPVTSLTTSQREFSSLHSVAHLQPQMLEAVLRPGPHLFPDYVNAHPPDLSAVFPPAFCAHLQASFNEPQLRAIHWAAAHTAAATPAGAGGGAGAAGGGGGSGGGKGGWPFTLVQGPPGTGKTHTVWGMLNAIHLVHFQRYYKALLARLAPAASASLALHDHTPAAAGAGSAEVTGPGGGSIEDVLESMDRLVPRPQARMARKPRMLVVAPSNAAVDELLARVLSKGFLDGEMRTYRPDVARVGAEAATPAAQAVSVERRSQQLLQMPPEEAAHHVAALRHKEGQLACHISVLQRQIRELAAVEEREQVGVEVGRLLIALGARRGEVPFEAARAQLEASFAEEAEVVFTTASSSGRRIFARLSHGFDMCVFDEAAQASEMAALPPLTLRCQRCVLVGDPQQLPATVISRLASSMDYSRSLLERFQRAGCPTMLLTEQYRMHPAIRAFPSRYFYGDRLSDAPSVMGRPDEPYHADVLLRPLLFFDVSAGRESHGERSLSYQNTTEAQLAVALFKRLQEVSAAAGATGPVPVGVVTPYRQQLKLLRRCFDQLARSAPQPSPPLAGPPPAAVEQAQAQEPGQVQQQQQWDPNQQPSPTSLLSAALPTNQTPAAAPPPPPSVAAAAAGGAALYVNTVDAFQGQERDAIILSCVRASTRGLGFVADVRRMNVAITRAKRALWILGNAESLQRSPAWAALIDDAKQRGCFLSSDAFAPTLLPSLAATGSHRTSPPRRRPPRRHSPHRSPLRFPPPRNHFHSSDRRGEQRSGDFRTSSGAAANGTDSYTSGGGVHGHRDGLAGDEAYELADEGARRRPRHDGMGRGRRGHGYGHGHGHRGGRSCYSGHGGYGGRHQTDSHGVGRQDEGDALPPGFEGRVERGQERDWKRQRLDN